MENSRKNSDFFDFFLQNFPKIANFSKSTIKIGAALRAARNFFFEEARGKLKNFWTSCGLQTLQFLGKISNNIPLDLIRPVADQPLFYIALVTIIVGVQLFLVGFISELIISINSDKNGYIIEDSDIK